MNTSIHAKYESEFVPEKKKGRRRMKTGFESRARDADLPFRICIINHFFFRVFHLIVWNRACVFFFLLRLFSFCSYVLFISMLLYSVSFLCSGTGSFAFYKNFNKNLIVQNVRNASYICIMSIPLIFLTDIIDVPFFFVLLRILNG